MEKIDIRNFISGINRRIEHVVGNVIPRKVGTEAVRHFKDNFRKEGFVNGGLHKWKEVKRRDPSSPWYGFDYKGDKRGDFPGKTNAKGKRKYRKRLNFSRAATKRAILTGPTAELQDSIAYDASPGKVSIYSDKPYAAVQNDGGTIKVFGKHRVQLPKRQFIGHSKELDDKITKTIDNTIKEQF